MLVCWVIPVNPHFITCGCLQRVFWVFVKQLLEDKAYVDVILHLFLTQCMEHKFHGNVTCSDCLLE